MRPPVNLDNLTQEWMKDAPYDETDPHKALANIPVLHAKYTIILSHHNLISKKLEVDYKKKKKVLWEWYSGDLNNPEDLAEHNLPPNPKKIMRPDIPFMLETDSKLNDILLKKAYHDEIIDVCKSVIKELNNRTFQLNSYIKWKMYINE
jgi:Recombination, repair and ssDNA binding protein UvsY